MSTGMVPPKLSDVEAKQRDDLTARLYGALLGAFDLASVYLGDRLGLYAALRDGGPATASQLARRAGIAERYAREWLEQQATTGILTVDATAAPEARVYALPRGHAEALIDRDSTASATPMALFLAPLGEMLPRLADAYRSGTGIPWTAYGEDTWRGQGDFNRPFLRREFAGEHLPRIADVHAQLGAGARVADVACGVGWAAIAIAKAYPRVVVDGYDLDASAIEQARAYAEAEGVADRVAFHVRDAAEAVGRYDLVTIIEALHDLSRPVEVLRTIRGILAPGGNVLVADENVTDTFSAPGDDVERLMYGYSITFCLPNGLAETPSAATGTVMRPATVRRYAMAAGFTEVEELPIVMGLLRFYRLRG